MSFPSHGVIITAAGTSTRFRNTDLRKNHKKEFSMLDDRSVLYHATAPFFGIPGIRIIVITYSEGRYEDTEAALDNLLYAYSVPVVLVQGGETRQQSVLNGLETLYRRTPDISFAMIHDGARPWISERTIISTLATATVFGGAAPAVPIHDAVKRIDGEGRIMEHIDRNGMMAVQTPQTFRFPDILLAHRQASSNGKLYLDDTEIFSDFGGVVGVSEGDPYNRKVTTGRDLSSPEEEP